MKYSSYILIFSISFILICCTSNKTTIKEEDRKKIEILLSKHKRYAFLSLYEKSLKQEGNENKIILCDSLFDLTSTELVQENCLFMDFYSKEHPSYSDQNYKLLINKWLNKDYPVEMPIDNPNVKTTMVFKKALDFYESSDLNNYIDSLRNVFYNKYNRNELKSLDCIK